MPGDNGAKQLGQGGCNAAVHGVTYGKQRDTTEQCPIPPVQVWPRLHQPNLVRESFFNLGDFTFSLVEWGNPGLKVLLRKRNARHIPQRRRNWRNFLQFSAHAICVKSLQQYADWGRVKYIKGQNTEYNLGSLKVPCLQCAK